MRAAARFHGVNALGRQGLIADKKLGVFASKDVVGHDGNRVSFSELATQCQHQRGLAAAHRAADADRKRTMVEIPPTWRLRPLLK